MGGKIQYYTETEYKDTIDPGNKGVVSIGKKLFYVKDQKFSASSNAANSSALIKCSNDVNYPSFVVVKKDASGEFTYTICLQAGSGNYYIRNATYDTLMGDGDSFITQSATGE